MTETGIPNRYGTLVMPEPDSAGWCEDATYFLGPLDERRHEMEKALLLTEAAKQIANAKAHAIEDEMAPNPFDEEWGEEDDDGCVFLGTTVDRMTNTETRRDFWAVPVTMFRDKGFVAVECDRYDGAKRKSPGAAFMDWVVRGSQDERVSRCARQVGMVEGDREWECAHPDVLAGLTHRRAIPARGDTEKMNETMTSPGPAAETCPKCGGTGR